MPTYSGWDDKCELKRLVSREGRGGAVLFVDTGVTNFSSWPLVDAESVEKKPSSLGASARGVVVAEPLSFPGSPMRSTWASRLDSWFGFSRR